MTKLSEYFKNVVTTIIGGIPYQNKDVGLAMKELDTRLNKTSYGNLFEMIINMNNNMKKDSKDSTSEAFDLKKMTDVNDDYQDLIHDIFLRRQRYQTYRAIIKKISRLKRAIKVFRSNIISSDNLNSQILTFLSIKDGDMEKEVNRAKDTFTFLNINKHKTISRIIDSTLEYGDYLAEIAVRKNFFDHKRMPLMESRQDDEKLFKKNINETFKNKNQTDIVYSMNISLDINSFDTKIKADNKHLENKNDEDYDDKKSLDDIIIIYHKPHNVIKLQLGNITYGYIIIPENIMKTKMLFKNVNLNNMDEVHGIANSVGLDYQFAEKALKRSEIITKNLIDFLKDNLAKNIDEENPALSLALTKLVTSSIFNVALHNKDKAILDQIEHVNLGSMPLRFVDVSKMQEFSIDVDEYEPWGTSIFDGIVFDSKLLISDKVTSTIDRITKSIERRIINYEIDDRNSTSMLQILKESFRKKKALFDGSTSFDNIPGIITPFEEFYIPRKDGQPFIEFTSEAPTSQHQAAVDDMKFKRDEITSDINIPPAYLGLEENIESKATLFLQNIMFAIEIIDYQEIFSESFTELNDKINNILDEPTGIVRVGFAKPVILSSASELEHLGVVSGVMDDLKKLGLNTNQIIDRYLPFLKEYFTKTAIVNKTLENLEHGDQGNEEEANQGGGF